MVGLSLSHYEITSELGRGGMGIVYRATDTKLNRDVALKILPAAALASEEDRARFFREAQSAAQLHHPNIATVFEIDEAILRDGDGNEINATDGPRPYIVMELIEGETLQDYIKKGPMKLGEAVNVASQVAEALKAAHAKDIVHRDIKSANVMITNDGIAKVLDFGLAKTNQSTMLTRMGSTLGTVAYMSPEQARGQEVDGRSDLFSLGTMMYEMIAGNLPYAGEYEQAVVYSILNEPSDPLTSVRTGVPQQLEWIVDKLMSKEAEYRYQSAAGLLADLKTVDLSGSGHSRRSMPAMTGAMDTGQAAATQTPMRSVSTNWGVLAAVVVVSALAGWFFKPSPAPTEEPIRHFKIPFPEFSRIQDPVGSPDGRYWAFSGVDSLNQRAAYLWDVSSFSFQKVVGSERRRPDSFSPDGNWIGLEGGEGTARARVPSGSAIDIDSLDEAIWLDNERLVTMEDDGEFEFWEVSAETGERREIEIHGLDSAYTDLDYLHRVDGHPIMLVTGDKGSDYSEVVAINIESGQSQVVVRAACCGKYHPDGTLLYLTALDGFFGKLVAQRYDPGRNEFYGIPVDLRADEVAKTGFGMGGDDSFFLIPSTSTGSLASKLRLSWVDPATGDIEDSGLEPNFYDRLTFSPDGKKIAMERADAGALDADSDIYVFDLQAGTAQRLTHNIETNRVPVWTASDKIYFAGGAEGESNIYVKNGDGSGAEQLLVEGGDFHTVSDDEQWLAYIRTGNQGDLYALNLQTGQEVAIDTSAAHASDPSISPDGRYIAYSIQPRGIGFPTGAQRVIVRSFPDPSLFFRQIGEEKEDDPFWSQDGKYLYYRRNGLMQRMGVNTEGVFSITSAPEDVVSFAGLTIRSDIDPVSGRLLITHIGEAVGSETAVSSLEVTLSFSRYLDQLFDDK